MRRLKRSTAFLQRSRDRFRGVAASLTGGSLARRKWPMRAAARLRVPYTFLRRLRFCPSRWISFSLVKAENVRVICGDLAQSNVACRDVRNIPIIGRPAPLLSCNRTEAQKCEHYSDSRCHNCFGRKFHALCVLRRCLQKEVTPSAAKIKRSHAVNEERIMFAIRRADQRSP